MYQEWMGNRIKEEVLGTYNFVMKADEHFNMYIDYWGLNIMIARDR
jgi:hypothetical protein